MEKEKELKDLFIHGYKYFLPHLSIDCVIFGYHEKTLKILINRWKEPDFWILPGGYIGRKESAEQSAERILKERTGLTRIYLQQFHTFSDPDRIKFKQPNKTGSTYLLPGIPISEKSWLVARTISIGFYALVEYSKVKPSPEYFSEESIWCDIQEIPELLFDHNDIIEQALKTLRLHINYQPIGLNLLPRKFTLPELQGLYETILNKNLDRRNFQKKMLGLGILKQLDERKNIGPHRAPFLYSFDKKNYHKLLAEGIGFGG